VDPFRQKFRHVWTTFPERENLPNNRYKSFIYYLFIYLFIYLLARICAHMACCYRFGRLKYIVRLFSEYMLTFMVEEPYTYMPCFVCWILQTRYLPSKT